MTALITRGSAPNPAPLRGLASETAPPASRGAGTPTSPNLLRDTQGAVMLTGLFMSCFLIGSLWFVVGVGDSLVFREKMQEASDHGAFTSAALHAKGMNFISLCNLVLLSAVTIHIILGIIHDIALAICIISIGFSCGFWLKVRKVYTGYFKILKPAAKAIHVAEVTASYGYPVMGLVEGMQIGAKYGGGRGTSEVTVLPLSTSLLPGALIRGAGATAFRKEGLPVSSAPMSFLCKKIVTVGFSAIFNQALGVSTRSPGGIALDLAKSIIGSALGFRYCNDLGSATSRLSQIKLGGRVGEGNGRIDEENTKIDNANANRKGGDPVQDRIDKAETGSGGAGGGIDPGFDPFWGDGGPMVVYGAAANGSEWFQTYALNMAPQMTDMSESRVGVARGPQQGIAKYDTPQGPIGYFAQAEFYFDCESTWMDLGCNYEENATFQIKWRARLRKLALPNLANMLGGVGIDALFNLSKVKQFQKLQGGLGSKATRLFGGIVGHTALRGILDFLATQAQYEAYGALGDATKGLGPQLNGSYH